MDNLVNSGVLTQSVEALQVQRDERTNLYIKKSFLNSAIITSIFAIVISCFMFDLYAKYTQNNGWGIFFVIFAVFLLLLSLFTFIVNMIGLFNTNFMWMTTKYVGGKKICKDVEDCNPYGLSRFAEDITNKQDYDYERMQEDLTIAEMKMYQGF